MVAKWEELVLDSVLNSTVFVISPRKKAPTAHFYSSQHVEKRREKKLPHICIQFQKPYTNVLRQRYLQIPVDLLTFLNETLKENISFHAVSMSTKLLLCFELRLKKSQFQKIIFLRDFDFGFDTYVFNPFSRQVVPKRHAHLNKAANFSCRFV